MYTNTFNKSKTIGTLGLAIVLALYSCASSPTPKSDQYLGVKTAELEQELDTLMDIWYPRIVDEKNGGYWTNFEYDWTQSEAQNKMLVTQARGLWTAARAASHYTENAVFRKAADAGYQFLTETMWDQENGGFFQNYPPPPLDPTKPSYKMTYGNAFALFGLAEYAKINKSPEVLGWVRKVFQWLEEKAHDPNLLGYNTLIFDQELSTTDTAQQNYANSLGWGKRGWKDQNTSIHVMEALATTYQVLEEPLVRARLDEMLGLIRDKMVHSDGYLRLYFTKNWDPISHRDSSRTYILENLGIDHQSFGHDIETAYLLIEASEILNETVDAKTLAVAKKLVDHTLLHGFDQDYYGLFDRGYRFQVDQKIEIVNDHKVWWGQAEAWHALGLMTAYFPEEEAYQTAFQQMWLYIKEEMIDPVNGGWYNNGLDTDPENISRKKAHQWKGAYHNGRALFQIIKYAKAETNKLSTL